MNPRFRRWAWWDLPFIAAALAALIPLFVHLVQIVVRTLADTTIEIGP